MADGPVSQSVVDRLQRELEDLGRQLQVQFAAWRRERVELLIAKEVAEGLVATAQKQRDEARAKKELAEAERDSAYAQRDKLAQRVAGLEIDTSLGETRIAPSARQPAGETHDEEADDEGGRFVELGDEWP